MISTCCLVFREPRWIATSAHAVRSECDGIIESWKTSEVWEHSLNRDLVLTRKPKPPWPTLVILGLDVMYPESRSPGDGRFVRVGTNDPDHDHGT